MSRSTLAMLILAKLACMVNLAVHGHPAPATLFIILKDYYANVAKSEMNEPIADTTYLPFAIRILEELERFIGYGISPNASFEVLKAMYVAEWPEYKKIGDIA